MKRKRYTVWHANNIEGTAFCEQSSLLPPETFETLRNAQLFAAERAAEMLPGDKIEMHNLDE